MLSDEASIHVSVFFPHPDILNPKLSSRAIEDVISEVDAQCKLFPKQLCIYDLAANLSESANQSSIVIKRGSIAPADWEIDPPDLSFVTFGPKVFEAYYEFLNPVIIDEPPVPTSDADSYIRLAEEFDTQEMLEAAKTAQRHCLGPDGSLDYAKASAFALRYSQLYQGAREELQRITSPTAPDASKPQFPLYIMISTSVNAESASTVKITKDDFDSSAMEQLSMMRRAVTWALRTDHEMTKDKKARLEPLAATLYGFDVTAQKSLDSWPTVTEDQLALTDDLMSYVKAYHRHGPRHADPQHGRAILRRGEGLERRSELSQDRDVYAELMSSLSALHRATFDPNSGLVAERLAAFADTHEDKLSALQEIVERAVEDEDE